MFKEKQIQQVSRVLKTLSNENRLKILCTLLDKNTSVNEIVAECGISQSAASQHLKLLKDEGFILGVRDKKKIVYQIIDKKLINVLNKIKENYCEEEK